MHVKYIFIWSGNWEKSERHALDFGEECAYTLVLSIGIWWGLYDIGVWGVYNVTARKGKSGGILAGFEWERLRRQEMVSGLSKYTSIFPSIRYNGGGFDDDDEARRQQLYLCLDLSSSSPNPIGTPAPTHQQTTYSKPYSLSLSHCFPLTHNTAQHNREIERDRERESERLVKKLTHSPIWWSRPCLTFPQTLVFILSNLCQKEILGSIF